ncbi:MAG: tetratricopeptide repeat protein, partial [Desulfobulbaceae bacterium]|nr:tetratricopeptide repeat protein [Desulfobulbaceae bacterium]
MNVLFGFNQKSYLNIFANRACRFVGLFLVLVVMCLAVTLIGVDGCDAASEINPIVPSRQVQQIDKQVPDWKHVWDTARRMVLAGDYSAAAVEYEGLLQQRPGLEEARWELAKTYIQMQDWSHAVPLLDLLIDASKDRGDYLNALAGVMATQKHWGRAVELYGRVLEKFPEDAVATEGMGKGLVALDRPKEALLYLERAYRQAPENIEAQRVLADLAYDLGEYEVARPHLVALAAASDSSNEILIK